MFPLWHISCTHSILFLVNYCPICRSHSYKEPDIYCYSLGFSRGKFNVELLNEWRDLWEKMQRQRFKSKCSYITELDYITQLPSCIKSLKPEFSTEALLWLQNIQRLMDHAEFHSWTTLWHLLASLTSLLPFNLISPYFTTLCNGVLSRSIFTLVKNNFRGGLNASADHSIKTLYERDSWEMKN